MLVPQPGIRTRPWQQKHQALTTGIPGNSLKFLILMELNLSFFFLSYMGHTFGVKLRTFCQVLVPNIFSYAFFPGLYNFTFHI